jgi:hypothetical protein
MYSVNRVNFVIHLGPFTYLQETCYFIAENNVKSFMFRLCPVSMTLQFKKRHKWTFLHFIIQSVPLATEPVISLIILTPMKTLQRNLNWSTFVVWEMKRNVSVACFNIRYNILISGQIIKKMLPSVASGTLCSMLRKCISLKKN